MAFCSNCGKELEESSVFCINCGVPVERTEDLPKPVNAEQPTDSNINEPDQPEPEKTPEEPVKQNNWKSKGLIIAVIALAVSLFLVLSVLVVFLIKGKGTDKTDNAALSTDSSLIEKEIQTSSMEYIIEYPNNSNYNIKGRFDYSYDGDRLIKVTLSTDGAQTQTINVEYDKMGNKTTDYTFSWDVDSVITIYKLYYDENNYLIEKEREDRANHQIFKNDSNGNPIHVEYYVNEAGTNKLISSSDSTYDELNRRISTHSYSNEGDLISDSTYYYSGSNLEPDYITSKYGDIINKQIYTYEYNNDGLLIRKVIEYHSSDGRISKTIYTNEYNDGLLIKSVNETYDADDNVICKETYKYTYNTSDSVTSIGNLQIEPTASGKKKVCVSLPTKDLQRWNMDGD